MNNSDFGKGIDVIISLNGQKISNGGIATEALEAILAQLGHTTHTDVSPDSKPQTSEPSESNNHTPEIATKPADNIADETVPDRDNEVLYMIEQRLRDDLNILSSTRTEFYEIVTQRVYKNVSLNIPTEPAHYLAVAEIANEMRNFTTRLLNVQNDMTAISAIMSEELPEDICNLYGMVDKYLSNLVALISPQHDMMISKMHAVFGE